LPYREAGFLVQAMDDDESSFASSSFADADEKDEGRWDSNDADPAANFLPLVYQEKVDRNNRSTTTTTTRIVEQPVDFTHLAGKYSDFAVQFIRDRANQVLCQCRLALFLTILSSFTAKENPFFLYVPFRYVTC
jgi:hypothetical protein